MLALCGPREQNRTLPVFITQYQVPSGYKYKFVPSSLSLIAEVGQNSLCQWDRLEDARKQWESTGRGENDERKRETDKGKPETVLGK